MKCVPSYTILLKPDIVHINTMKNRYKKIGYHVAIGVSIDYKVEVALIFEEIWFTEVSSPQIAPKSHL